jgi:hypothetical protein
VEGVIGNPRVRERISKICVGLAAPCDPPEVEETILHYFSEKFAGAPSLPFAAFMTHDFEFVHGFTGGRTVQEFLGDLDEVEGSPLLPATAEDAKKLTKLGETASKAADKLDWAKVVKAGKAGAAIRGRCDERGALDAAMASARGWAAAEFQSAVEGLLAGAAPTDFMAPLTKVKTAFKGEPEADTASTGKDVLKQFDKIAKMESKKPELAAKWRETAAKAHGGTVWGPVFGAAGLPEPEEDEEDDLPDDGWKPGDR